jgi:hypothetical protein
MRNAEGPWDFDATADHRSAQVIQIEALGRGGLAAVLLVGLMGVILGCIAIGLAGRAQDRAQLAEREARVATDKMFYLQSALDKAGIHVDNNH